MIKITINYNLQPGGAVDYGVRRPGVEGPGVARRHGLDVAGAVGRADLEAVSAVGERRGRERRQALYGRPVVERAREVDIALGGGEHELRVHAVVARGRGDGEARARRRQVDGPGVGRRGALRGAGRGRADCGAVVAVADGHLEGRLARAGHAVERAHERGVDDVGVEFEAGDGLVDQGARTAVDRRVRFDRGRACVGPEPVGWEPPSQPAATVNTRTHRGKREEGRWGMGRFLGPGW